MKSPAEIKLEKMRHSLAVRCFSTTAPGLTVEFTMKLPSTPASDNPYRLYPMAKVFSRVPKIAKIMMERKLSKNACLIRVIKINNWIKYFYFDKQLYFSNFLYFL